MGEYTSGVANSICMVKSIVAVAQDDTDGSISVDFNITEDISAIVQVKDDSNVLQNPNDLIVTVDDGVVTVADGSSTKIITGYTYIIMAVRDKS